MPASCGRRRRCLLPSTPTVIRSENTTRYRIHRVERMSSKPIKLVDKLAQPCLGFASGGTADGPAASVSDFLRLRRISRRTPRPVEADRDRCVSNVLFREERRMDRDARLRLAGRLGVEQSDRQTSADLPDERNEQLIDVFLLVGEIVETLVSSVVPGAGSEQFAERPQVEFLCPCAARLTMQAPVCVRGFVGIDEASSARAATKLRKAPRAYSPSTTTWATCKPAGPNSRARPSATVLRAALAAAKPTKGGRACEQQRAAAARQQAADALAPDQKPARAFWRHRSSKPSVSSPSVGAAQLRR